MKDGSRKVANQTHDFLPSIEDLSFCGDGSPSDSAFLSDFSNGSVRDLGKSPASDVAVSYERNSLKDWTDRHPHRSSNSCDETAVSWSRKQSISHSDRRECNEDGCTEVKQSRIKRNSTDFKRDWAKVSSLRIISPELRSVNLQYEDAGTQQYSNNSSKEQQEEDLLLHEPHRERHFHWNLTHESLTPITEWQDSEQLGCYDSDDGISDIDSSDSDALCSPSSEDASSLVRPDFVPKLDLSWVFEDEKRKLKRPDRRIVVQRCSEKGPEIKSPECTKLLKTSINSITSRVTDTRRMKDKAEPLLTECPEEASRTTWQHKDTLQGESTDSEQCHQVLAQNIRQHDSSDNEIQIPSADVNDNAQTSSSSKSFDRALSLTEGSKDDQEIYHQQSCRRCWSTENSNSNPHFRGEIMPTSEPRFQIQTRPNSMAKNFNNSRHLQKSAKSCSSGIVSEDYEQPEQQPDNYEKLATGSLRVNENANDQRCPDKYSTSSKRKKAGRACAVITRPRDLQSAKYYVVDERDSQAMDNYQRQRDDQETVAWASGSNTVLEIDGSDSGLCRLNDDPQIIDPHFVSSGKSDSNNDLKVAEFKAQTTNIGLENELEDDGKKDEDEDDDHKKEEDECDDDDDDDDDDDEEEEHYENPMAGEHNISDELYDVEAAVVRHGRRQKLAKLVCCFVGFRFSCCQQNRCRPCYCAWKCDLKHSR